MNKRIKFRAWDEISKEMVDIEFIDFSGKRCEQTTKVVGYAGYPELRDDVFPYDKLMQFTGLRAKNRGEIYEGDIVKNQSGDVIKVISQSGSFGFDFMNGRVDVCGTGKWCNIIGNIYKNPELLSDAPMAKERIVMAIYYTNGKGHTTDNICHYRDPESGKIFKKAPKGYEIVYGDVPQEDSK